MEPINLKRGIVKWVMLKTPSLHFIGYSFRNANHPVHFSDNF